MEKKEWLGIMNLADEKYVKEADPLVSYADRRRRRLKLSLIAAGICIIFIAAALALFVPFKSSKPDISSYSESAYYPIIQRLSAFTYKEPKYKNNFDKLADGISGWFSGDKKTSDEFDSSAAEGAHRDTGEYVEITDNQVSGVIEADKIKRSDKYIYYLDGNILRVFTIEGDNSKEAGSYELPMREHEYSSGDWEFYLSDDCRTVTVVGQRSLENKEGYEVKVTALDVSEPKNIREKNTFKVMGAYLTSRVTKGELLLMTRLSIDSDNIDFEDESTFLPQIDKGNGMESIPSGDIIFPETLDSALYTVVIKMDAYGLELKDCVACLSYSRDIYVSNENIFLSRTFYDKKDSGAFVIRSRDTELLCLNYSTEGFEKKGSVNIQGYIKDQYSMDEYNGILRVVTTTYTTKRKKDQGDALIEGGHLPDQNVNLYCIDTATWEIAAEVIGFAPWGEMVQSARFDKDTAYVCTSVNRIDPVFFFDLSDINDITYKSTGEIDGFSTSLVNFGNGKLLGIGVGDVWNSFKAEIYEETEDGVRPVCAYNVSSTQYSENYKSYYIDYENQFLGLGLDNRYVLLAFDGKELKELVNVLLNGENEYKRGVYIDGYMYMFGQEDFAVVKVFKE